MLLLVTYLEMLAPPTEPALPVPSVEICLERECLSPTSYLALYRAVGESVHWDQRLRLRCDELIEILRHELVSLFVLRRHGEALGLCEYDARQHPEIELVNFGVVPSAQGQGLGRFLMDYSLREIWKSHPQRIWLHTDTNDHVRAMHVYRRADFREYLRRMEEFPD